VSQDVGDAVDSVLSEVMPAFTGEAPVEFVALSPEDEQQAALETDAVNHVAKRNGMYLATHEACRDALLFRVGCIKVHWDQRLEVSYQTHSGVPLDYVPQMVQAGPGERVDIIEGEIDEVSGIASGTIRRTRQVSRPSIEAVPLAELLVSAGSKVSHIEEARFVAHRRTMTRSELVELGATKELADNLSPHSASDEGIESEHKSTDEIMVCESYYRIDVDGDGIAERRRVITAGGDDGTDDLIMQEPWDDLPFCIGTGYLGFHEWRGKSLFDKLSGIQDQKTELMRDFRNLVRRASRQRLKVRRNSPAMDSLMASVLGGIIEMDDVNDVQPMQEVVAPPMMMEYLGMLNTSRRESGGGAIDHAAQAMQVAGDTAHGIERVMSVTEARNAMIARNLAETLLMPLYRKLHKLMRQYMTDPLLLPGSSGWRAAEPAQWSPREHLTVAMGMSVGERGRRSAALQGVIGMQAQDDQAGATDILNSEAAKYQARVDFARMAGLPNPQQYFRDPSSPEAQQVKQGRAQQAEQQAQQQQQMAMQQMEFQYKLMTDIERVKAEANLAKQQLVEEGKKMQAMLSQAEKMFGHRVDLAKTEVELDQAEAQREVNALQEGRQ